ncbi:hypothetical protein [Curtobacterium sp. VKM Ac-1376]|uniref:hypothetical protein n=1 Tax=Curtobacterium sp. VKM Ac-1376 TaxID=123312 RepID=UPI00188B994C|nr:hypothetical protein [Curtobacterium sp. VKM Ac-1376]MBF4613263.1 hypothetical protein [Curtobacterium sp. VKM Ac-1376]
MALTTHAQGGAPRQAQDGSTKRVVLAGRLDSDTWPNWRSLNLSLAFAGQTGSVAVYGIDLLIDLEVVMLATDLEARRRG